MKNKTTKNPPAWRTKWPRNGDLSAWLRAIVRVCDAITDPELAADKAHLPIKHLAEKGSPDEAFKHLNRFLRRLPKEVVLPRVWLAKLGAQISLNIGDLLRMEKYLAIIEATEPFNTRKCDKGFSVNTVRKFRAEHGLLDSTDGLDEEQRAVAEFERAARLFQLAMADGDRSAAKAALPDMEEAARAVQKEWFRRSYLRRLVKSYAKAGDAAAVKRCLADFDQVERDKIFDADTLVSLGMKHEAIERAQREIARRLRELGSSTDPNIHFPVMAIGHSLELLVQQGAEAEARQWLQRVLKEMPKWRVIEIGWMTSSVYQSLAKAVASIDGPAAAEELMQKAAKDAATEHRGDYRKGAVGSMLQLKADFGKLDEAIAEARKMRSPTERRKTLAKLLARAQRWTELHQVLNEAALPEEAAEIGWWLKFELPGGAAA